MHNKQECKSPESKFKLESDCFPLLCPVISGDTACSCAPSPDSSSELGASPCPCAFPVFGLESCPVPGREFITVLGRDDMGDRMTVTPLVARAPIPIALPRPEAPLPLLRKTVPL